MESLDDQNLAYAQKREFEKMRCTICSHLACPHCAAQGSFWCDAGACADPQATSIVCLECTYGTKTDEYLNTITSHIPENYLYEE